MEALQHYQASQQNYSLDICIKQEKHQIKKCATITGDEKKDSPMRGKH